ncbi:MAG: saccharopine dehydrogenase, partial [Verrucomicrobiota bacterium]
MLTIWLRNESKPFEQRTPLTPADAATLVKAGIKLIVEHSDTRIFSDNDYASAGCTLTDISWEDAPDDAFILGLKELPTSSEPLRHRHIYFAHAFKGQAGWKELLSRFQRGGGTLYDLEYLEDETGRRVAAFGTWAGFAGAAVAAMAWGHRPAELPPLTAAANKDDLIEQCRKHTGTPRVMIIGAAGRCGRGATELFRELHADLTLWDMEETDKGGPFEEILEHDILVNGVFVSTRIPPFLTPELLEQPRRLSIICDVSCDPSGDLNPLPLYDRCTTFAQPLLRIAEGEQPVDLIAIDHLPSLLPRESSEDFSQQLLPHLLQVGDSGDTVWTGARHVFQETLQ